MFETTTQNKLIGILFAEEQISLLFAELVKARGGKVVLLDSASGSLSDYEGLITEPRIYNRINQENPKIDKKFLVVGNSDLDFQSNAINLSRPLTEEKVEQALTELMG